MANYDYKCKECNTIWSTSHGVNETPEIKCPLCGSTNVFKYLGNYKTLPIKFIGPGWTVNDRALDAIGMPEATRESPEAQDKLFRE